MSRYIKRERKEEALELSNYKCAYCGDPLEEYGLQFDHVVPISKGGDAERGNILAACKRCNISKNDLDFIEFKPRFRKLTGLNVYYVERIYLGLS